MQAPSSSMSQSSADQAPPRSLRALAPWLGLAAAVLAVDQLTKALIRARLIEGDAWPAHDAWLAISHVENSGAAFGTFQGGGSWLLAATIVGVGAVVAYLWRYPPTRRLHGIALSFILGGAIGNLIDRATKGTVTDFIDPAYYPAFNIADSAVVVGVSAIFLLTLLEGRRG